MPTSAAAHPEMNTTTIVLVRVRARRLLSCLRLAKRAGCKLLTGLHSCDPVCEWESTRLRSGHFDLLGGVLRFPTFSRRDMPPPAQAFQFYRTIWKKSAFQISGASQNIKNLESFQIYIAFIYLPTPGRGHNS